MPQDNIKNQRIKVANAVLLPEVIKMIQQGHSVTLPLRGYSMRPFLEDNRDKALLVLPDNIKEGDAVLAEIAPQKYVLHRLIRINGDKATLRGDGNLGNEYCRISDIKAKAIGFYRKGHIEADYVTERKWRIYSWLWTRMYPIRRYLLFIYRHFII